VLEPLEHLEPLEPPPRLLHLYSPLLQRSPVDPVIHRRLDWVIGRTSLKHQVGPADSEWPTSELRRIRSARAGLFPCYCYACWRGSSRNQVRPACARGHRVSEYHGPSLSAQPASRTSSVDRIQTHRRECSAPCWAGVGFTHFVHVYLMPNVFITVKHLWPLPWPSPWVRSSSERSIASREPWR